MTATRERTGVSRLLDEAGEAVPSLASAALAGLAARSVPRIVRDFGGR